MPQRKKSATDDGLEIVDRRLFRDDPQYRKDLEVELEHCDVAQKDCDPRRESGLTQQQPAERVGTSRSVTARLEDAEYEGHSLTMLRRIAAPVGRRVEFSFPPADQPSAETARRR